MIVVAPRLDAKAKTPKLAAVPETVGPKAARIMATNVPTPHTARTVTRLPSRSRKTPYYNTKISLLANRAHFLLIISAVRGIKRTRHGTRKNPKYCEAAEYQPAVTASTLKRCSASSVAFCEKMTAVEVWKTEKAMTPQ
jgi:hypothetical protein